MGAMILSLLLSQAQPLALTRLEPAAAKAFFSKAHLVAAPARDSMSAVVEPVTIFLVEVAGTDQAAIAGLPRVLDPATPQQSKGWEALLWNYAHAGSTGTAKITPRSVRVDGRSVAGAQFVVTGGGKTLYAGLMLTQLLPGARVRIVIGVREGDAKAWLDEVGPASAFLLTEGMPYFSPAPEAFGRALKVPTGCAVELAVEGSKRVTITCTSAANLTWAPVGKEPNLDQYQQTLEQAAKGSPCEFTFKRPACTVAGLPAQCLLAECPSQPQASSLTAKVKFEGGHWVVACANAVKGYLEEPVCNGLFRF